MKRLITLLCSALLMCALVPMPALAASFVWTQTTHGEFSTGVLSNVSTTRYFGSVVLLDYATSGMTQGSLESTAKALPGPMTFETISWTATSAAGSGAQVKFQIATNNDNATWDFVGPDGTPYTYYTSPGQPIWRGHNGASYVKYKAYLSTWTNISPVLGDVSISYHALEDAPVTTALVEGQSGDNGWYTSVVTVSLAATDDLSGVASTRYSINGGPWFSYVAPITLSAEGTSEVRFGSTDNAGNREVAQSVTVKIDSVAPTVSIASPLDGAIFTPGQFVAALWAVAESGSGIVQTDATAPTGQAVDTLVSGPHTFAVTARDAAGNVGCAAVDYSVQSPFDGFLKPVESDGTFQLNRTVPIKFHSPEAGGTSVIARAFVAPVSADGVVGAEMPAVGNGGAENLFRLESDSGCYQFNWSTKDLAEGEWRVRVATDDGASYSFSVTLRSQGPK